MKVKRGDTKRLKFKRIKKADKSIITELPDKLFFTVKYNCYEKKFLFQKSLTNGITYNEKDNYYYFKIMPKDTDNLPYGEVVFDIEVIVGEDKATIAEGVIDITEEVTHACNEECVGLNDEEVIIENDDYEEIITLEENLDSGTNDYEELTNQPKINDVILKGNKTSNELNLQGKMQALSNIEIEKLLGGNL